MSAVLIFLGTYLVLALGRMPGLRVDRTGAAIIGASLMVATRVLSLDEAYRAIQLDTIVLLFGMMIVVANLRLSGFFGLVSEWVVEHTHSPLTMLIAVVFVSGALSAFFVNDAVCLVLAPLVAEIAKSLRRNPVPYLLAVAMASNIGSAATITGNPQNMLIGIYSHIGYAEFARRLAPVAALGLIVCVALLALLYRSEFRGRILEKCAPPAIEIDRVLLAKSLTVSVGMVIFFFLGWPLAEVAIVSAALLLITRRVHPEEVYRQIDWSLLVLFVGLFIVIAGLEKSSVEQDLIRWAGRAQLDRAPVISALSAVLSNIVSNVPAVLVFKPFMAHLADPKIGWLRLAMATTLAGNLTVLGSVANLIVLERSGERIGFWEYTRAGLPLGIITIAIGALLLR